MNRLAKGLLFGIACVLLAPAWSADAAKDDDKKSSAPEDPNMKPQQVITENSVTIGGRKIDYKAVAGTIILTGKDENKEDPTASIFYAAYFKHDESGKRPITFFYNGGPGSSTVWLHMGAFGPKRVITADDQHTPAAPYRLANNEYSLLDATDLVFIDAPGTGFSRLLVAEKDKDKKDKKMQERRKEFYGVDQDGEAFTQFITKFLSQYGRWNSPKYLFGESYGTTRSAVLANKLETEQSVDLNGIILLSQILSFSNDIDAPQFNPGVDQAYALALPTYAATAWYHKKLTNPPTDFKAFLSEVETFAMGEYASALAAGTALDETRKHAIAEKLHNYTGLPIDYIERANLRVNGGEFEHTLQIDRGLTTGRLDSRFSGPAMDPLNQAAAYDPQSAAISSAYVAGGVVSDSNEAKSELLGVDPQLIAEHGAVSEPVAEAMAAGALRRFGADTAISMTGIAGPGGGSAEKPVGTVCFSVQLADGRSVTRTLLLPGSRSDVRERSTTVAMHLLRRLLSTPAGVTDA